MYGGSSFEESVQQSLLKNPANTSVEPCPRLGAAPAEASTAELRSQLIGQKIRGKINSRLHKTGLGGSNLGFGPCSRCPSRFPVRGETRLAPKPPQFPSHPVSVTPKTARLVPLVLRLPLLWSPADKRRCVTGPSYPSPARYRIPGCANLQSLVSFPSEARLLTLTRGLTCVCLHPSAHLDFATRHRASTTTPRRPRRPPEDPVHISPSCLSTWRTAPLPVIQTHCSRGRPHRPPWAPHCPFPASSASSSGPRKCAF